MTFENRDMQIISPLYPKEGQRYVEPIKEEVVGGWDNSYNISKDYINPTIDKEMRWRSTSSASSNSEDALENWNNRLHEVLVMEFGRVTQSLHWVATEVIELPKYEGIPNLADFIDEFEDKVSEPQRLLALEEALKATPTRWWDTHKKSMGDWNICH